MLWWSFMNIFIYFCRLSIYVSVYFCQLLFYISSSNYFFNRYQSFFSFRIVDAVWTAARLFFHCLESPTCISRMQTNQLISSRRTYVCTSSTSHSLVANTLNWYITIMHWTNATCSLVTQILISPRSFELKADSRKDMESWIHSIDHASRQEFYDVSSFINLGFIWFGKSCTDYKSWN